MYAGFFTNHARTRSQQRGIPPLIEEWLDEFGELEYDGHGGVTRYFSRYSIRRMERVFGRSPVRKMSEFLGAYKVESSRDSSVITVGYRRGRVRRK